MNDPHCDSRQQCVELGSEIAKSRGAKALALCVAKMNDPHCDSRQQCGSLGSEITNSAESHS
nr:hypothetical protein [Leptospira santarosai]